MTASGRAVRPLDPDPETIIIEDIAHHLSQICRFAGATCSFYSVAQHSVLVSREVPVLAALLHDAAEYILGDIPRPLKRLMAFAEYREVERRLQSCIFRRFNVSTMDESSAIAIADRRMLRTEQRDLMPPALPGEGRDDAEPYDFHIALWGPDRARYEFLLRFAELQIGL